MKTRILTIILFTLLVNAMYSNIVILNGLTHVYTGSTGETITGEVILINSSDQEQRVTFELNEAIFSCTSNRIFIKDKFHQQSSSKWFSANLMDKLLAPREKYVYKFSIKIPNDKSLKGSFWSMLMVNVEKPIKEESLNTKIGLDTKIRYAIGLLTNVNAFDNINLDFSNINLKEDSNSPKKELEVKVLNESLFIEGVKLSLEIYDNKGIKIQETETDRNMVFPGFCRDFKFDVSVLPNGEYNCVLIADARREFVGTNISLSIK